MTGPAERRPAVSAGERPGYEPAVAWQVLPGAEGERPDWLPTDAELAEAKADALDRRLAAIKALTPDQCQRALRFVAAYDPKCFDYAMDAVAEHDEIAARARDAGTEGGEH